MFFDLLTKKVMKWLKWGLVLGLVVAAAVVFSAKFSQKKYTFYYYPEWNAYYDVSNKNYIYSIDGGKTWDTITNSSNAVTNTLGEKIVLHSNSPEIWMENTQHRNEYGGTLNDLVGNFLETGEDKRKIKKKNSDKGSIDYAKNTSDSLLKDSSEQIENWVKETTAQDKNLKEHEVKDQKTDLPEEETVSSEPVDSTETN